MATDETQEPEVPAPEVPEESTPSGDPATPPDETGGGMTPPPDEPPPATSGVTADEANPASPTGGENTAGTPQSQLDQAPPMVDESGSNIDAPNLVQPVHEDALGKATPSAAGNVDPALTDPVGTAVQRVEGRTSDAATRAEGTHIDEVPADLNEGPKPSDAGPEAYPFPQGGDVEIASIPEGSGEGEYLGQLTVEDAVILGEHDSIPERLQGRRAFITDAPRYLIPVGREDDVWITVKTRDEVNATLTVPLSAVKIEKGGTASATVRG